MKWDSSQIFSQKSYKTHKNRSKINIIATKPAKKPKNFMPWIITTIWHQKNTCEGYKGSVLIKPEQAIEKADYKCGKSFYLDPILDTYKKKIIENPIVDKILDMIAKANIDRLNFGLKKITNNHSHVVFRNEDKYQNYNPDPDSKTKIIYSRKLVQYGDIVGLRYY